MVDYDHKNSSQDRTQFVRLRDAWNTISWILPTIGVQACLDQSEMVFQLAIHAKTEFNHALWFHIFVDDQPNFPPRLEMIPLRATAEEARLRTMLNREISKRRLIGTPQFIILSFIDEVERVDYLVEYFLSGIEATDHPLVIGPTRRRFTNLVILPPQFFNEAQPMEAPACEARSRSGARKNEAASRSGRGNSNSHGPARYQKREDIEPESTHEASAKGKWQGMGRHPEASPDQFVSAIPEIGRQFRLEGRYEELMSYLETIRIEYPELVGSNEEYWDWWIFSAISLGYTRHEMRVVPQKVLRHNPRLQIVLSGSRSHLQKDPNAPNTIEPSMSSSDARRYGVYHGLRGNTEVGEAFLEYAYRQASAVGDSWQQIKIASGMAYTFLGAGDFRGVVHWAHVGRRLLSDPSVDIDRLLRLEVVAINLYGDLLTQSGSDIDIQLPELLDDLLNAGWSNMKVPHMDFIYGTIADHFFSQGEFQRAEEIYSAVYEAASEEVQPALASDVVRALSALKRNDEARDLALKVAAGSSIFGTNARITAKYAVLLARTNSTGHLTDDRLPEDLGDLIREAQSARCFIVVQQALVLLTLVSFRRRDPLPYNHYGQLGRNGVAVLSPIGWGLLSGNPDLGSKLSAHWQKYQPKTHVQLLLGTPMIFSKENLQPLSLRAAEILACLTISTFGLSSSQLAVAVYGDNANASTAKAAVSRLRSQVSIFGNPYRFGEPVNSDLRQFTIALERGLLQKALDLYTGPLLPDSQAPMIVEEREALETALRAGVLARRDPELMYRYVQKVEDDLEVWAELLELLDERDPRRAIAAARVRTLLGGGGG